MLLLIRAIGRRLINVQNIFIARYGFFVTQNIHTGTRILKRFIHPARDHIPLCSDLQITTNMNARLFGNTEFKHQIIWRYKWDSSQQFLLRRSVG